MVLDEGNWELKENLRPEINPMGTLIQFSRQKQSIAVFGITVVEPIEDISWVGETIQQMFAVNFSRLADTKATTNKSVVSGISCDIQTWEAETETIHTVMFPHDQTIYCLVVVDAPGGSLLQQAMGGFHVLP
jgi:hypothetical protein